MALNRVGGEVVNTRERPPAPITLPRLNLPDLDAKAIEAEAKEAAARVRRTSRRRSFSLRVERHASMAVMFSASSMAPSTRSSAFRRSRGLRIHAENSAQ